MIDRLPPGRLHCTGARTALVALACASAFAARCGGGPDADGTPRLRLAHIYEVAAPTHRCGAAEVARELAGAGLELQVFPAAQLGHEGELLEQLATGQLEMAIAGPSFLGAWHEPIGVFDAAYLFEDIDHQIEAAQSDMGQQLWEELRVKHGVRVLDNWTYGARHITAKRPIRRPADLRGFRLRLPNARVWQASGEALGASPMPIAFAEVYLALQQGIADGQENPIATIQAMGFHEVQTHLNLTGHVQSSTQLLIGERIWERLTAEQQAALVAASREAGARVRACVESADRDILDEWRRAGTLEIVEDVDLEAFREQARRHFSKGFAFSELYGRIQQRDY